MASGNVERLCPYCHEAMDADTNVCPHCSRRFVVRSRKSRYVVRSSRSASDLWTLPLIAIAIIVPLWWFILSEWGCN